MERNIRTRTYSGTRENAPSEREIRNRRIARRAAAEGIVLLKNDGVLPLAKDAKTALFGGGAVSTIKGGTGSGDVNEREVVSIYQGFLDAGIALTNRAWLEDFERIYRQAREDWRREILDEVDRQEEKNFFQVYSTHVFCIGIWLAPGMNIHRNPLCGRNFEYFSEDPLLGGRMAAAITRGVQSRNGVGTTIKHFACNNQEDNRTGCDSIVLERALREIYLRGFEIAVKEAQPMAIMTSYNLINGVHTANSRDLCTVAAREEWNFQGIIMTDWTTTSPHGGSSAWGCVAAGNDLIMPGCEEDRESIRMALADGRLDISQLRACVERMLSVIFQTNAYEDSAPYGAKDA